MQEITEGLLDDDVSFADRFRVGTAELVVTQPRLPCFKLGIKLGRAKKSRDRVPRPRPVRLLPLGRREGEVEAGDPIVELVRDPRRFA